jgi:hypothetical protein
VNGSEGSREKRSSHVRQLRQGGFSSRAMTMKHQTILTPVMFFIAAETLLHVVHAIASSGIDLGGIDGTTKVRL